MYKLAKTIVLQQFDKYKYCVIYKHIYNMTCVKILCYQNIINISNKILLYNIIIICATLY